MSYILTHINFLKYVKRIKCLFALVGNNDLSYTQQDMKISINIHFIL